MNMIYPGGGEIPLPKFRIGDHVRKVSGSRWQGIIVGTYSTALTPEGYCVESDTETGSVQIYPAKALEPVYAGQRGSLGGAGMVKK